MRLSKLYCNKPDLFGPIQFAPGLNVVVAEIRLPQNQSKDTHNLGKTTLGRVIDFCLLKGADQNFFLVKHQDVFAGFIFFLEVELLDGSFVTIRRGVDATSKSWFKLHNQRWSDFTSMPDGEWDHSKLPFDKALKLLDGILDLRDLSPWSYRKLVGYLLRSQSDYQDVFQLSKFKGKDADWKPFLAQVLGFDAERIVAHYAREVDLDAALHEESIVQRELGGSVEDLSKIEGMLLLKTREADDQRAMLDRFDFQRIDAQKTRLLVDDLDTTISALNADRYGLSHNRQKIACSLEDDEVLFDTSQATALFAEAGVVFAGQLKKDFDQLIAFNRAITEERRDYLLDELQEVDDTLKSIEADLTRLDGERQQALVFLADEDSLAKYKHASDELVTLRADIVALERQRESLRRLQVLRKSIRVLEDEALQLRAAVEEDVEGQNADHSSLFSEIRVLFGGIVKNVIDRTAVLSVSPNKKGHLDFGAEIRGETGRPSSADAGNTYRKLLCIALDLAILRARINGRCSRFVFHDGVFESLDDRKKERLLVVMREYADAGVQQIITLIDSDLPSRGAGMQPVFSDDEIVLRLHDEGNAGRLFRMPGW